jgi:hypothetical protein
MSGLSRWVGGVTVVGDAAAEGVTVVDDTGDDIDDEDVCDGWSKQLDSTAHPTMPRISRINTDLARAARALSPSATLGFFCGVGSLIVRAPGQSLKTWVVRLSHQ